MDGCEEDIRVRDIKAEGLGAGLIKDGKRREGYITEKSGITSIAGFRTKAQDQARKRPFS